MRKFKFFDFFVFYYFVLFLFFLFSVFYDKHNEQYEIHSESKNYKVVIYKYIPISLLSIHKIFDDRGYFFVIFDKCGREVYKSPLNYGVSANLIYDETKFSTLNGNELFFPTNEGIDSIVLQSVPAACISK